MLNLQLVIYRRYLTKCNRQPRITTNNKITEIPRTLLTRRLLLSFQLSMSFVLKQTNTQYMSTILSKRQDKQTLSSLKYQKTPRKTPSLQHTHNERGIPTQQHHSQQPKITMRHRETSFRYRCVSFEIFFQTKQKFHFKLNLQLN